MAPGTTVEIDGRRLNLSNLDKVLYPEAHTTKAEVIDYYARIAPVMLAHTAGRCITMRRYPNGVDGQSFFEKRCPSHRPDWVPTAVGPGDRKGELRYCRFEEPAALAWAANLAALELHAPMARSEHLDMPHDVRLRPGPGSRHGHPRLRPGGARDPRGPGLDRPRRRGQDLRLQGPAGVRAAQHLARTPTPTRSASSFALAVAQLLEKRHRDRVTTTMAKAERPGKVFVDWSQNAHHKTTVAVYSLRARPRPTVSTPVTWDEVAAAADGTDPLVFEFGDVLDRVADLGDLFAPAVDLVQRLPRPKG